MKSRPRTDNDATTTVRVVHWPRPPAWLRIKPLKQGNKGHRKSKNNALENPVATSFPNINAGLNLAPERTSVDTNHEHTHHPAADDASCTEYSGQQGHGDDTCPKPWRQNPLHWIDSHHLHDADLLTRFHQPNFGC